MGWFSSSEETKKKHKCKPTNRMASSTEKWCGKRWGEEVPVSELPDKGYERKMCPDCEGDDDTPINDYSGFDGGTGAGPSGNSW